MSRNVWYWALYDFANSIPFIVFIFYLSQWLVVDQGNPAWWFNATLIGSSLLFIAIVPFASTKIDARGNKLRGLRVWTCLSLSLLALVAIIAVAWPEYDMWVAVGFTFALYAYLMCYVYFTPMLSDLSTETNRARISGIGQAANAAGQVAGLVLTYPFVEGLVTWFGASPRAETLLPSVLAMAVLSIPMLVWYKEPNQQNADRAPETTNTARHFFDAVIRNKPLALFLVAYFLVSDALLTFSSNFTLFLENIYGTADGTKAILAIGILVFAAFGGAVSGYMFAAAAVLQSFALVAAVFLVGGLFFGPVWAVSRAVIGQLALSTHTAASYAFYVIADRFATFIGPLTWSGVLIIAGENELGYRLAIFSMAIIVAMSLLFMRFVPETNQLRRAS